MPESKITITIGEKSIVIDESGAPENVNFKLTDKEGKEWENLQMLSHTFGKQIRKMLSGFIDPYTKKKTRF